MTNEIHIDDIVTEQGPGVHVTNGNPERPTVYFAFIEERCGYSWMYERVGTTKPPYDATEVEESCAEQRMHENARRIAESYSRRNGCSLVDHTNP